MAPPGKLTKAVTRVLDKGESSAVVADALNLTRGSVYAAVSRERKKREASTAPRKAGIRQGKAVEVTNGGADKNPNQINFTGLRDFVAFEVKRLLPEVVAAEMSKRFGGGA